MKKSIKHVLIAALTLFAIHSVTAANYVLVHGAWADAHAYDAIKPMLESKGHRVTVVNLPGHGQDQTPVAEISLQSYVDAVGLALRSQSEPAILVGHSMGGMVVSQVAEIYPEKIKTVVYIAAYLPKDGEDLLALANQDGESLVGRNLEFAPDKSSATIARKVLVKAICADCSRKIREVLVKYHKAEPSRPLGEKVRLTEKFRGVKKIYIHTSRDNAVGHKLQKKMVQANGSINQVFTLPTSHLPFLVKPQAVVEILEKAAH